MLQSVHRWLSISSITQWLVIRARKTIYGGTRWSAVVIRCTNIHPRPILYCRIPPTVYGDATVKTVIYRFQLRSFGPARSGSFRKKTWRKQAGTSRRSTRMNSFGATTKRERAASPSPLIIFRVTVSGANGEAGAKGVRGREGFRWYGDVVCIVRRWGRRDTRERGGAQKGGEDESPPESARDKWGH